MWWAAFLANGAARAGGELDLDDFQQAFEVHLQASCVAGVENGLQKLSGCAHEVVDGVAGARDVASATEVIVRDSQGLKAGGSREHCEGAFGRVVESAELVIVAAGVKFNMAQVFLHVPDLVEEQLEGSRVYEDEFVEAVKDGKGVSADLLVDPKERGIVVWRALSLSVFEYGQGYLFRTAFKILLARVGRELGGV